MPERNGIELLRALKGSLDLSGTPVVLMSNNNDPDFRKRALSLGAVAYLLKTDGARLVAENAVRVVGRQPGIFESQKPSPCRPNKSRQRGRVESLVALLRLVSSTKGLPIEVAEALVTAGKLVYALFAAVPAK